MREVDERSLRTRGRRLLRASGGLLAGVILCMAAAQGAPAPGGASVAAGQQSDSSPPPVSSVELEEVEVIGKKLYQMQRDVVQAQDRFYAAYNELNTKDDFDVHCVDEALTGTLMRRRECRLEFLREAMAAEGQEFFLGITSDPPRAARFVQPPVQRWFARKEEYRAHVRQLLESSPELQSLASRWMELQAQYEKARKARHKDRLVLFE